MYNSTAEPCVRTSPYYGPRKAYSFPWCMACVVFASPYRGSLAALGVLLWVMSHCYQICPPTLAGGASLGVWARSILPCVSPHVLMFSSYPVLHHMFSSYHVLAHVLMFSFTLEVRLRDRDLDVWGPWDRAWSGSGHGWLWMKGEEQI